MLNRLKQALRHVGVQMDADREDMAQQLKKQGNDCVSKGQFSEAEACYRRAFELDPRRLELANCLGFALIENKKFHEARQHLLLAVDEQVASDDVAEAYYMLGQAEELLGSSERASTYYRRAVDIKPDFTYATKELCRRLYEDGRTLEVKAVLQKCVSKCPEQMEYRLWLSDIFESEMDFANVVEQLEIAHADGLNNPEYIAKYAAALGYLGRPAEAASVFDLAIGIDDEYRFNKCYSLGSHHVRAGNYAEAIIQFEDALAFAPGSSMTHSMLLLLLTYSKSETGPTYPFAARRFADAVEHVDKTKLELRAVDRDRAVIRLGFVSADFRDHPVYYFLTGFLSNVDREKFRLYAYSSNLADDHATLELKGLFDVWVNIKLMDDIAVAKRVQSDEIDILVDLSGHTGNNRLPVFAYKPAPVQVSWLGYFASTGLTSMDYVIADPVSVSAESREWFSEEVYRIDGPRLCMRVPQSLRSISAAGSPRLLNGYVTFGCFQQPTKLSTEVLSAWARIMESVPNARLRIQGYGLEDKSVEADLVNRCKAVGLDLKRTELHGRSDFQEYMDAHNLVDILLDTFPYNGATTTAFALWLGTPTITIAGNTMISRQGAMFMTYAGLKHYVAQDINAYVDIAVQASKPAAPWNESKAAISSLARESRAFDTKEYATNLMRAFEGMQKNLALHRSPSLVDEDVA